MSTSSPTDEIPAVTAPEGWPARRSGEPVAAGAAAPGGEPAASAASAEPGHVAATAGAEPEPAATAARAEPGGVPARAELGAVVAGQVPDDGAGASPAAAPPRRFGAPLSLLGLAVSAVALGGVVYWALQQDTPRLPSTGPELAALVLAAVLYGLNTLVRGVRWQRLLGEDGAHPRRVDTQSLNAVGYAANNVLPARAGDAIRVVLMAPRAHTSKRTVVGTLVAERLLDVAVIVMLFVIVGYGVLGQVGAGSVEVIALVTAGLVVAAALAVLLVRRNERLHRFLAPMASATFKLRRGGHGARLLAMTVLIWSVEGVVWMSVGHSVGFGMSFLEGLYLVALASVFALIPSGPGYAGTQDAATAIGIKALGGSGATAVAYMVMLRLVIVVPVTLVGLTLLITRYGGLGRLRAARAEARAG
jgi:uncharacterized membrane protein YbhN (UPF0104 family)